MLPVKNFVPSMLISILCFYVLLSNDIFDESYSQLTIIFEHVKWSKAGGACAPLAFGIPYLLVG